MSSARGRAAGEGIVAGSLAGVVSQVVRLGCSFVIGVLVARGLGASAKGELTLLQQIPAIVSLVLGLGLGSAHAYYVGRGRRSAAHAVSDSLAASMVLGGIGVVAAYLVMSGAFPSLDGVQPSLLALAAASVPFTMALTLLAGVATGLGEIVRQSWAQMYSAIVTAALVAVMWLAGSLSIAVVVGSSLAGLLVGVGLLILAARTHERPLLARPSWKRTAEEAGYAIKAHLVTVASYLELRQDAVLLGLLASTAAVGVYSVGVTFAEVLWYVPQNVAAALLARALKTGDEAESAAVTARTARVLLALVVSLFVLLALIVPWAIPWLFGKQFAQSVQVFFLLAPGVLAIGFTGVLVSHFAAHGRLFPGLTFVGVVVNLALNLALIPLAGVRGAAVASSLTYGVTAIVYVVLFKRSARMSLAQISLITRDDVALLYTALRAVGSGLTRRVR